MTYHSIQKYRLSQHFNVKSTYTVLYKAVQYNTTHASSYKMLRL